MLLSPLQRVFDVLLLRAFVLVLIDSNTTETLGTGSPGEKMQLLVGKSLGIDTGTMVRLSSGTEWTLGKAHSVEQVLATRKEMEKKLMQPTGLYKTGPIREAQEVHKNIKSSLRIA